MSGSNQRRRFEESPPELTAEETVAIPEPGEPAAEAAPAEEADEYDGYPHQLPDAVAGFPHAPHGQYEGPVDGVEPTDLLECRMDEDKFEEHSPLGVAPTHHRLHRHPHPPGHVPK